MVVVAVLAMGSVVMGMMGMGIEQWQFQVQLPI